MARMESGPFQPDGDWPGYFMRGDDALATANMLRALAEKLDDPTILRAAPKFMVDLADRLETCYVTRAA